MPTDLQALCALRTLRPMAAAALRSVGLAVWTATLVTDFADAQEPTAAQHLPTLTLNAGIRNIVAELADTPREREIGLMFREHLPTNAGMLFAFETRGVQCFWMRNTLLPLSAAFIADDGAVVNIVDMAPQTLDSHCSSAPVRYVLEMAQGWFARAGVKTGSRLTGLPPVPPGQ